MPHVQVPEGPHESAVCALHALHAEPARPHVPSAFGLQVEPLQHPSAQVVALHPVHMPLVHGPAGQLLQFAPPVPHLSFAVPGSQVVPLQQPDGHDVESHTHAPASQRWPGAHAAPSPHAQPSFRHESAVAPHAAHASPSTPQDEVELCEHMPSEQHPSGHDEGVHAHLPFMHACPAPHVEHSAPFSPQASSAVPLAQDPAVVQQPVAQDVAVHLQASDTHSSPASHTASHAPHVPASVHRCTLLHPPAHDRVAPALQSAGPS